MEVQGGAGQTATEGAPAAANGTAAAAQSVKKLEADAGLGGAPTLNHLKSEAPADVKSEGAGSSVAGLTTTGIPLCTREVSTKLRHLEVTECVHDGVEGDCLHV
jgi:hypothetical protein